MLSKTEKTFSDELRGKFIDLAEVYDTLLKEFVDLARERGLDMEYANENESRRETPDALSFQGNIYSIRDSRLFNLLVRGSLEQLKEVYNSPVEFAIYIEEIFGGMDEYLKETGHSIEMELENREREKEAA